MDATGLFECMKKTIMTLMIALAAWGCAWAGKPADVESLVRQYEDTEGFEVLSMGQFGMSLIRFAVSLSGDLDDEDRAVLSSFSGIKHVTMVDYEGAEASVKEKFAKELTAVLDGMELILEAKDGGTATRIYGIDDGNTIRDCVIYSGDGALIYTKGSIDMDRLGELMELAK